MEMGVHAGGGQQHYNQCRQQPRHSSHVDAFLTSGASLKVQGLRAGKPQHGPRKDEGLSTPWIPTTYARAPATMAPVTFTRRPENPFIDGA
jgi:hypothetical protein